MFRRYRQFEGMTEEEVSAQLREQAAERRHRALARVEPIDLSATTWPEYPPSTVVNAITYAARRARIQKRSIRLRIASPPKSSAMSAAKPTRIPSDTESVSYCTRDAIHSPSAGIGPQNSRLTSTIAISTACATNASKRWRRALPRSGGVR